MAERLSIEGVKASHGVTESGKFEVVPNGFGGTTTVKVGSTVKSAPAFRTTADRPATDGQIKFLRDLVAQKTPDVSEAFVESVIAKGFDRVSAAITKLKAMPTVAQAPTFTPRPNKFAGKCEECGTRVEAGEGLVAKTDEGWAVAHNVGECPATGFPFPLGRFALRGEEGVVRFFQATTEGLFVMASDELHRVPAPAQAGIIAAIAADPEAASRLFGQEIGSCGRCGRTLTDEESRREGIGPVCARKAWA